MPLQKEGVILAAEGANQFIAAMGAASKALEQLLAIMMKMQGVDIATKGLEDFSKQKDKTTSNVQKSTGTFAKFFKGFGLGAAEGLGLNAVLGVLTGGIGTLGVFAGQAATGGIKKLVDGLADLAKQTAPLEGLQAQFANLTAEFEGGTSVMLSALRAGASGMISNRDLMQQFNNAASLVNIQFAERLPEALSLLGKVSAATGTDMAYLMDSLVNGVGKVSNVILDNLKIQVSSAEATAKAEEMFGKEADTLTKLEQQTAMADLALAKLEEKYGALPSIAGTASAQMAMLSANFQNIKDTLGQYLLPAFSSFLQGVNALVSAFGSAISEGGAFYPILVNLGAALAILADGFQSLAHRASDWLDDLNISWTENIGGMAQDAIQWGADIVTNFAVGMIDAANTVLTWAMQQISNILNWWLAPGSPPKVAPKLDKWGLAAFESYLHGMTEADFGILESVQGPLKKVLEGPQFADVSKAISGALAGGDRAGALDILANSSRQFGDDIAELARREFALADATQAVTDAENALLAAQERAAAANKKVATTTREYNRLLREGASQDILDAQLQRIQNAEKEAAAAKKDVAASETGLEDAKSRVDVLKEQVEWQQRFLNQLFGINEALTEEERREKAAEKATKDKGKAVPEVVTPTGPAGGIGGAIANAIEAAKGRIKESLGGIWSTIKTEFSEKWNQAIGELGETWNKFVDTVGEAWDRLKERWPFLQDVETWIVGLPEKIRTMISDGWDKFKEAMDSAWSFIDAYLMPILKDLKDIALLGLQLILIDVKERFNEWLDSVQKIWSWLKKTFLPFIEDDVKRVFNFLADDLLAKITYHVDGAKRALEQLHEWLQKLIDKMREWISVKDKTGLIGKSPSPLAIGIQTAADAMEQMAAVSIPKFNAAMAYQPTSIGAFRQPAGNTYNSASNSFAFNTTVNNGMDQAGFEAAVLRVVRRGLAQGAV